MAYHFINLKIMVLLITALIPCSLHQAQAQNQTAGLFLHDQRAFNGYTFFTKAKKTFLINMKGRLVHSWVSEYSPGNSVYLLENGNILRTNNVNNPNFDQGGKGGRIQEIEWDGTVVWDYVYSTIRCVQHHDIERLPNGNVLMIAWEIKTTTKAILAGRNPDSLVGFLWVDHIIEVKPTGPQDGDIVWEWHMWDHLIQDFDSTKANYGVVEDHPELMDINYFKAPYSDWMHTNSIDYNADLDQIVISVHQMNEIFVIDHSTTTEEAAGHTGGTSGKGGDILYRWGNPRAYRAGTEADQKFFGQHDAQWIETGLNGESNILVFNNGLARPQGDYSSIEEIAPPVNSSGNYPLVPGSAHGPAAQYWIYTTSDPTDFYSAHLSGAQRLPNGNTLICSGNEGRFFEITPGNDIVWEYINPITPQGPIFQGDTIPTGKNSVFRCYRYAPDYPGLAGRDLTPGDPLELYNTEATGKHYKSNEPVLQNCPNPFKNRTFFKYYIPEGTKKASIYVYDISGRTITQLNNLQFCREYRTFKLALNGRPAGVIFALLKCDDFVIMRKAVAVK
jgi:hypothetical protein